MAFMLIRVECPSESVGSLNSKLKDSSNANDGLNQLVDLMGAISSKSISAEVDVIVRDSTQTITAADGGGSASYNLK